MPDVEAAGLARRANEIGRPGQEVEGLIPDLLQVLRLGQAPADAGIRAVEEQAGDALRPVAGQALGRERADVVGEEADRAVEAERVEKSGEVVGKHLGRHLVGRPGIGLLGITKAAQIRRDEVEALVQERHQPPPGPAELWPAVQEHERRPGALAQVMDAVGARIARCGRHR